MHITVKVDKVWRANLIFQTLAKIFACHISVLLLLQSASGQADCPHT